MTVYLSLGANLGNARETLKKALSDIASVNGISDVKTSSFYGTEPIDSSGPDYVNCACSLETTLEPEALLDALQAIENTHGRTRPYKNAPRTLDIDIVLIGNRVIGTPRLTVPHPRMHLRAFVLAPLLELNPDIAVPGLKESPRELLPALIKQQRIVRLADNP
ncbi:MAG: 2-amino-4-hydroxy-6-hydroxymethyldihydropteridine diphosphokinase [Oscillospiraceae bacterium]|nr:2-amino-4-hydroxy-6-hydroxymethyldihydropteridine diphosphokinase [Oscillospiraceae bacterium]